jgi:hypothetical protein
VSGLAAATSTRRRTPKAGIAQGLHDAEHGACGWVLHTDPAPPFTPAWEVALFVRADAGGFLAGDRVAAMPVLGGFPETLAVDADLVFPAAGRRDVGQRRDVGRGLPFL